MVMAERLNVDATELNNIVINTIMPAKVKVSNEQFTSFLAIANEYNLNPLVKEIYAFPAKGGGIQPVVGVDGWIRIAQNHSDWNGMAHEYIREKGKTVAVTCKIHRKSMDHPIEATEWLDECMRPTDPWKNWPTRMLKHKATIQAIRYAFGISGIVDQDEAERYNDAEKDITPSKKTSIIEDAATVQDPQEVFDTACDQIENAAHPGELQQAFGEAWSELKAIPNTQEFLTSLKDIYDEKKAYFEEIERKANG